MFERIAVLPFRAAKGMGAGAPFAACELAIASGPPSPRSSTCDRWPPSQHSSTTCRSWRWRQILAPLHPPSSVRSWTFVVGKFEGSLGAPTRDGQTRQVRIVPCGSRHGHATVRIVGGRPVPRKETRTRFRASPRRCGGGHVLGTVRWGGGSAPLFVPPPLHLSGAHPPRHAHLLGSHP